MTVSMEEYRHHICIQHHNYIDNCIKEFTSLTEEEERNFQQMMKWNKKQGLPNLDVIPIECVETGKRYKDVYECARALGKSVKTIQTYIKFKHSYFGRHYKYVS